ncbi:hypothetical protein K2F45_05380 [Sphingobacterium siyangense]|uniref:hypothetical protein n=1 Tax=Sphingobacterium siyangense TaxID=459529 RepID=UPI00200CD1DD|nr:hypothetical protein [Sphingobacterium siyangense]UQA76425.1 hypothetical protein K2F45_05380 [Sphingobacterium siyangense]
MSTATALVKKLALEQKQDILCEINSHIFEALQQQLHPQLIHDAMPSQLQEILDKLGLPETFIKEMILSTSITPSIESPRKSVSLLRVPIMLTQGLVNMIYYIIYTLMLIAVFLVVAKFIDPQGVGFFYAPNKFFIFGKLILQHEEALRYEQLGNYFIPAFLFIISGLYYSSTLILKLKKSIPHKL